MDFNEDLDLMVVPNEDDTEVTLVVRSISGKKVHPHEFVMMLEEYLHEITKAEAYRIRTGASTH